MGQCLKCKYSWRLHYIIITLTLNISTATEILACYDGKVDQELLRETDFESNYYTKSYIYFYILRHIFGDTLS